jgi:hypothetical protein
MDGNGTMIMYLIFTSTPVSLDDPAGSKEHPVRSSYRSFLRTCDVYGIEHAWQMVSDNI